MPLTNDIELNGVAYVVAPGQYKKTLRKALAVSKPPARRIGQAVFGPFERGVLQASDEDDERGWSSLTVGPVFDGEGVEPFPNSAVHVDAMPDVPSTTNRAYGLVAGTNAYVGIGRRIYKSVLLTNGTWASFTVATDFGAGFTISAMSYFQDDILVGFSTGQDIRKLNTATNAVTIWRTGEKAQRGVAYAGQFIYAPMLANNQEELRLSGTKWNGNAVTHKRYLDAPIVNMASFNGQVVIATRKSLYFMGGQPYPGEADDPDITGDSSRAPEWRGEPDPVMSHGVFAEGDDFTFLESYRGRLYTWLGGRVAEYDDSTEEANWLRIGPEGVRCYGACVAADWLIVAVESRYGSFEAWGFNGHGWWLLLQRAGTPAVIWPAPLAGAGNRDVLLFRDGVTSYDLLRLRWRSTVLHTYATGGEWVSSLIDGEDPTADKAWRRMGATFAAPGSRGNAASVDSVSFPLQYSVDGGVNWTTAVDEPAASGSARVLTREIAFPIPPVSRVLQLRQQWSSVSDWAPVLTSVWVEFENAEEYALGELAQDAYEAALLQEGALRRRWELTVSSSDRNVRRDGQLHALTGRQAITALWDAWELGTTLNFKDIDNDTDPVTYVVAIVGIEEKAVKPADSARWGESAVTLTLEESSPGAGIPPAGFGLDDLDDVTLGALVDGQVLAYDAVSGTWINELQGGAGPHTHAAADIVSGLLANGRIGTGAPDGTKFLRDDQVWATPPGGGPGGSGDVVGPGSSADNELVLFDGTTGKLIKAATQNGIILATAGVPSGLASSGSGDVLRKDGPVFGAGSASANSKPKLSDGALLTVPELGALEFLGGVPYFTPKANSRAVNRVAHLSRLDADSAHWANVTTATPIFPTGQDEFNAPAGTTYVMTILCRLLCTGATTSILSFGLTGTGTATFTSVDLMTLVTMNSADNVGTTTWHFWTVTPAVTAIALTSGATAKHMNVRLEGTVEVNGAGTIVPLLKWSAAPGAATTVKRGAIWLMEPIGTIDLVKVGDIG